MERLAYAMWVVLGLAACGGGGGGGGDGAGSGIDPRLARLDIYEAQKLRVLGDPGAGVMGLPEAEIDDLPDMGTYGFTGSATIRVETASRPLILFADAGFEISFGTGDGTGAIERAFGTNSAGDVADYGGVIMLTGTIEDADLVLDYQGDLTAGVDVLGFDGRMQGSFLGDPVSAFAAADLESEVDHSGERRDATLVVIGEGGAL